MNEQEFRTGQRLVPRHPNEAAKAAVREHLSSEELTAEGVRARELAPNFARDYTESERREPKADRLAPDGLAPGQQEAAKRRDLAWEAHKSALKFDDGKAPLHLIPPAPLFEIAQVLAFGAKKYEAWNWSRGFAASRLFRALLDHMWQWWSGVDRDPESGLSHLAHAGCMLLFLMDLRKQQPEGWTDDRPVGKVAMTDGSATLKHTACGSTYPGSPYAVPEKDYEHG